MLKSFDNPQWKKVTSKAGYAFLKSDSRQKMGQQQGKTGFPPPPPPSGHFEGVSGVAPKPPPVSRIKGLKPRQPKDGSWSPSQPLGAGPPTGAGLSLFNELNNGKLPFLKKGHTASFGFAFIQFSIRTQMTLCSCIGRRPVGGIHRGACGAFLSDLFITLSLQSPIRLRT